MPQRLILTSYPKALTGSRTGFCTVARSRSMSEKLASLIEKIGSYEHTHGDSPIVFSHKILNFAGKDYHVLSRIVDAGVDYTNRTNFLADHIVFSSEEIVDLPNPADVLLEINDWYDEWNSEPMWLDDYPASFSKYTRHTPAKFWNEIFGDAGAASLLARKSGIIGAKSGDEKNILKLFSESLSLFLNPSEAWGVTFTTYFGKNENSSDVMWKTYMNPSLGFMQANPDAIDFTNKKIPAIPESKEAEFARSGILSNKDRLNLKAASPTSLNRKVIVRHNTLSKPESKIWNEKSYLMIAVVCLATLLAVLIFFTFYEDKANLDEDDFETQAAAQNNIAIPVLEQYQEKKTQASPQIPQKSFEEIKKEIDTLVMGGNFKEALLVWKNSSMDKVFPNYEINILKDVSTKCSILINEVQTVLNTIPDKTKKLETLEKLNMVKEALEFTNLPNREKILTKWKKLESEIAK